MSEENREFGSEIGNTMTGSQTSQETVISEGITDCLHHKPPIDSSSMEKETNGTSQKSSNILSPALASEVFSIVQNNNSDEDELLDEIEDLLDDAFYIGEKVYHNNKELEVVGKEKRGGLVQYTMATGQKINQRELKRHKELTRDYFKNLVHENAIHDGKLWKVNESIKNMYKIKEKLAPIFCTPKSASKPQNGNGTAGGESAGSSASSSDEESEERKGGDSPKMVFHGRASGGMPAVANRKVLAERQKKEKEKKLLMEAKEKEKAEKKRKAAEEKAKIKEEKQKLANEKKAEAKKANAGKEKAKGIDKFLKKKVEGADEAAPHTPAMFSPVSFSEKRLNSGLKKLEDGWKKRDIELFNEACIWCEKNLSGVQVRSIENEMWRFSIQKLIDKNKDKVMMKAMKGEKKQEYRLEMQEKRKDLYKSMEPKIRTYFSEDFSEEDLLLTSEKLVLAGAFEEEMDAEKLQCMEITQFFIAMHKILEFEEKLTAEDLLSSLRKGPEGFKEGPFKMYRTFIETLLQEEEYEKIAHLNARLHEFPVTEMTITEIYRAFFIGKTNVNPKVLKKAATATVDVEEMAEEEHENVADDVEMKEEVDEEGEEKEKESEQDKSIELEDRSRYLAMFNDGKTMDEWPVSKHIELLQYLITLTLELPIVREWYVKDVGSETLAALRTNLTRINKEIEEVNKLIADLPPPVENIESLTRTQSREYAAVGRKREKLEQEAEELRIEHEQCSCKAAKERDDILRAFRTICIGEDRHLRRYYWFANSFDAGIWVQDFGVTNYEKWVRKCEAMGIKELQDVDLSTLPELEHEVLGLSEEKWFKIMDEDSLDILTKNLKSKGKREKLLKKYIRANLKDMITSFKRPSRSKSPSPIVEDEKEQEEGEEESKTSYVGHLESMKSFLRGICEELQMNHMTKLNVDQFKKSLADANDIEKIKRVIIELVESMAAKDLLERLPYPVALAKKAWSLFMVPRFVSRVEEADSLSALHMLVGFFESRIDWDNSIRQKSCAICRKKNGIDRKLECKTCTTVYHYNCVRPFISKRTFEVEGFKENWVCLRCHNDQKRSKRDDRLITVKVKNQSSSEESESDNDEDYGVLKSRKAKRKATGTMKEVIEQFENPPKRPTKEPAKKVAKMEEEEEEKEVSKDVQELFQSLEKKAPRFYKVLQNVPAPRATRGEKGGKDLQTIEQNLDAYETADDLRQELSNFFTMARNYIETHNSRKLEELDELISALDF